MNTEWRNKLIELGLKLQGDNFVYAGEPEVVDAICTLSDTVLHVAGADAELFLQAQFSNDIAALVTPGSQLNTWSSAKGRVISLFRVNKNEDGYHIRIPTTLSELVLKKLRMLAGFSRTSDGVLMEITIEPRDDLIVVGVSGEAGMQALTGAGVEIPPNADTATALPQGENASAMQGSVTRVRGEHPRVEIIANPDQMAEFWSRSIQDCTPQPESTWRLQNIDAGMPTITSDTSEAFVLQMLNLQHLDGVSFKKGCFPGQEVVARMQYLGKLKRQMFRLQYKGDHLAQPGDEIYKAGGGSAVGKVVDAADAGDGTSRLLAVIAIDATAAPLYLDKEEQQILTLLELPYATPAPE